MRCKKMQVIVQYTSELVAAVGLFLATLLLVRFTSNRVKQLPDEEKHLGRPLWVATIGISLLGIASLLNYQYALTPSLDLETIYYLVVVLGAGVFAISATMIMGWDKGRAFPVLIMAAIILVAVLEQTGIHILGGYTGEFTAVFAGILFGIPFVLFSYLTVKTKRITSFGFAVLAITYPLLLVMTSYTHPYVVAVMVAIRLYGPALLITALILPETGIGAELMVYAMTVSSLFYFMSYLLISPVVADVILLTTVTFIAIASVIGIGTSAYTLTRWRKSRNNATLTLGVFFFVAGFSFLIVALNHIEFMAGVNAEYVALFLGLMAPLVLNLSAIVALEWNRLLLLPALIAAAPMVQMMIYWPQNISPDLIPMRTVVMAVTGLLQSVLPLALYGVLWWRMRKAGAPGRSRALFLSVGTLFLIFGTMGGWTMTLLGSLAILVAYSSWWLGVTGRADRLLRTTTV
jgi:hypothetical protein